MPVLLAVRQSQNDKKCIPQFEQMVFHFRYDDMKIQRNLLPRHRNSIPPTTTVENLQVKQQASKGKLHVDVGFWGGIIPGNEKQLKPLLNQGVVGFKCFLCPSGVDEFPNVEKHHVDVAYQELKDSDALIAVCISSKWTLLTDSRIKFIFLNFSSTRKFAAEAQPVTFPISLATRIHMITKPI